MPDFKDDMMKNSKKLDSKRWGITTVILTYLFMLLVSASVIIIDPYFHYHKPLKILQYPIDNEWYQNDGIVRHFDYNALITGTSMTENFKTSEVDKTFDVHSVKTPYSGGSFLQMNMLVEQSAKSNPNLKMVIRGLDLDRLIADDVTAIRSNVPFPEYLYNDDRFDDVNYILNKDVFLNGVVGVLVYTGSGSKTTSFDTYANWNSKYTFGKKTLDEGYTSSRTKDKNQEATDEEYERNYKNIEENAIAVAKENPDIQFYYFITPYSIYYFDSLYRTGTLEKSLLLHEAAIKPMLNVSNIKLFSFLDLYSDIENLDNYKDIIHYGEWMNSDFLYYMKNDEHLVTKENYDQYCKNVNEHYMNYDYDSLFENGTVSAN